MLRMNPPDILHTVPHGIMEYNLGFVMQCIKLFSKLDDRFSRGPKYLSDNVRFFPNFHSLYPVRHIHFPDIWSICVSDNSKKEGKSTGTTNIINMSEFYKIVSALFQVLFSCIDNRILPSTSDWSKEFGFSPPYFNPRQVVVNSLMSTLQIHWYIHATSLSETQVVTLQMLISNAHAQLQILDFMRKRLLHRKSYKKYSKVAFTDVPTSALSLMENPKLEMLSHLPQCIRENGCDTAAFNTELGELQMKVVRAFWSTTSKRKLKVAFEILKKYRNLSLLKIMKQGLLQQAPSWRVRAKEESKNRHSDIQIAQSLEFSFFCNKWQSFVPVPEDHSFKTNNGESFIVHDLLLQVPILMWCGVCTC